MFGDCPHDAPSLVLLFLLDRFDRDIFAFVPVNLTTATRKQEIIIQGLWLLTLSNWETGNIQVARAAIIWIMFSAQNIVNLCQL